MKNSEHTPGPWKRAGHGNGKQELSIFRNDGKEIACIRGEAQLADARLIAAAPELLYALREIVSQIDQGGSGGKVFSRDACIAAARAAIAKAVES